MANIELNEQEAQVLINIINVAVQSKGLEIAESSIYLVNKINKSFKEINKYESNREA